MNLVASIFRNLLGKPVAPDFRDSAEHFVAVLRESGISLTWEKGELRFIDALTERLAAHNEYRDAVGCYLGELLVRNFPGAEWVPGHALGPAMAASFTTTVCSTRSAPFRGPARRCSKRPRS